MKYYHLFDLQTGELMSTGRNSKSLDELKESLLSYLSVDHDEEELKQLATYKCAELCELYEFTIEETTDKLNDL